MCARAVTALCAVCWLGGQKGMSRVPRACGAARGEAEADVEDDVEAGGENAKPSKEWGWRVELEMRSRSRLAGITLCRMRSNPPGQLAPDEERAGAERERLIRRSCTHLTYSGAHLTRSSSPVSSPHLVLSGLLIKAAT
ncbi:hypothetical protein MN608_09168 [Microdochium nivale]|nr:hypothetical protein MN608_09168 [Microdochium nivale]